MFQPQLLYSKTINRSPHNSEKERRILNNKLEKARGSKGTNFSTSYKFKKFKNSRVQEFKNSSVQV